MIPVKVLRMAKKYIWLNWATTEELSREFKVSQRRIQQVLADFAEKNLIEVGVVVIDIGTHNPISKPIYKRNL